MKHVQYLALALVVVSGCAVDTTPLIPAGEAESELLPSEAYHDGTDLVWLRCPVGMSWEGLDCSGVPADLAFDDAILGCQDVDPAFRLPTLSELATLLGSCSEATEEARCRPCEESTGCSATLSAEEISEWTWTSDQTGENAFVVEVSLGRIAYQDTATTGVQTRCVRSAQ